MLQIGSKTTIGNEQCLRGRAWVTGHEQWMVMLLSGLAAGVAISASPLTEAFLRMRLPRDEWTELVVSLGYTVGFVIVILGKLHLFTESTVTAVLPLATHPTFRNFGRLLRLWTIVFVANMVGTFFVALLVAKQIIVGPEQLAAALDIAKAILKKGPEATLLVATPAGFLIASIAWILPSARGSAIWVIILITYVISLGQFSHVVAGSGEAWLLMLMGHTTFADAVGRFILPSFVGNVIGGTGLFAVLAHGQVSNEIETSDWPNSSERRAAAARRQPRPTSSTLNARNRSPSRSERPWETASPHHRLSQDRTGRCLGWLTSRFPHRRTCNDKS